MKLKELLEKVFTYHVKLVVTDKEGKSNEYMYDTPSVNGLGVDEMDVTCLECTTEIDKETPITHTIMVRPILKVSVKEACPNEES